MKTRKQSKVLTFITMLVLVSMLLVPTGNIRAQAAQPPAPASPFEGNIPSGSGAASTAGASSLRSTTSLTCLPKWGNTPDRYAKQRWRLGLAFIRHKCCEYDSTDCTRPGRGIYPHHGSEPPDGSIESWYISSGEDKQLLTSRRPSGSEAGFDFWGKHIHQLM